MNCHAPSFDSFKRLGSLVPAADEQRIFTKGRLVRPAESSRLLSGESFMASPILFTVAEEGVVFAPFASCFDLKAFLAVLYSDAAVSKSILPILFRVNAGYEFSCPPAQL